MQANEQLTGAAPADAMDIAVVGMACRFPGAADYGEYWQNLVSGKNCIREIPSDRWDWRQYFGDARVEPNKTSVKWGGFIDDLDKFDPLFFGISPTEAAFIDPQHRLFLEAAWHAVEDAGYSVASLSGKAIGVYAGVSKNDYSEAMREGRYDIAPYVSTGTVHSILANRVSFLFNLRGRSEAIDTACSSSLVALHNAIRDIANGECEAAIVGGVNALITPTMFISHSKSGMLSPDGQCKTFSATANGYVRSEGVGVVYIKPLQQALRDGDHVHAVIKTTAVSHGGRSNFLTAPNTDAQAAVVSEALRVGNIDPRTIDYVEAHGTGTPLGDPIEIDALKKAFAQTAREQGIEGVTAHCALSAVKTNVGHLESASGMAGMIKVIMALEHRQIPAIRNFTGLNPYIELENSPFFIATENVAWEPKGQPRRAGLSSFGMGGVNAHVVLEEAPAVQGEPAVDGVEYIVPLSAKKGRLGAYAESLLGYLNDATGVALRDIAFTLQSRDAFDERVAFAASTIEGLIEAIEHYITTGVSNAEWNGQTVSGRRVPMPTYPFARRRCWFSDVAQKSADVVAAPAARETGSLKTNDFFIRDHVVQGKPMLPGVMHLELARAAGPQPVSALKDVYWIAPVIVEHDVDIDVRLNGLHYEIRQNDTVHSKGTLVAGPVAAHGNVDFAAARLRCSGQKNKAELYDLFRRHGLAYGSSFQVIESCVYNDRELVAELQLPREVQAALGTYALHPSLMDGVFQAVTALSVLGEHHPGKQYVPFHLESAEIVKPMSDRCLVYAKLNEGGGKWPSFNATLTDDAGRVLVRFENLQKRPIAMKQEEPMSRDIYYRPEWRTKALATHGASAAKPLVLFAGDETMVASFATHWAGPIVVIEPGADVETRLHELKPAHAVYLHGDGVEGVLQTTQAAFKARLHELKLVYVHTSDDAAHSMIAGFARTLKYENPKYDYVTVGIDDASGDAIARVACAELFAEPAALREVAWRGGERFERRMVRETVTDDCTLTGLKTGGVYVVAGGAGGLGSVFSRYLAEKHGAKIVWLGRSAMSPAIARKATAIGATYFSVDITHREAVNDVVAQIRSTHGEIHGVIHAAGLIEDAFILRKQRDSFARVIEPKVLGAINLDAATQNEPLDFFVVFSSIAALMPNQGQCDYAAANSFLDSFAEARNRNGQRSGVSLSINWPLWADGGIRVSVEEERHLMRVFGMKPLPTAHGLEIFETALALAKSRNLHQLVAIDGDKEKIERCLGMEAPAMELDDEIKSIFAAHLGVSPAAIDGGRTIGELGIDSTVVIGVIRDLNKRFAADLKPTLLFDINTVDKLAAHLVETGRDKVVIAPWNRSLIDVEQSDPARLTFSRTFRVAEFYLRDHVVEGQYNMPGACYVEMARQAGDLLLGDGAVTRLLNNYWVSQLSSPAEDFTAHVQLVAKPDHYAYEIFSVSESGERRLHAMGQLVQGGIRAEEKIDLAAVQSRCGEVQYPEKIYEQIIGEGLHVGPTFQPMQQIFLNDAEALGMLVLPEEIRSTEGEYVLNPALLTGVFQTALIGNRRSADNARKYIPIGMDELEVLAPIPAECCIYSRPRANNARNEEIRKFDLEICRMDGVVVGRLKGFSIRALKETATIVAATKIQPVAATGDAMLSAVQEFIKSKLAGPIGLPAEEIDSTVQFDRYGVTSVMVVELNQIFEEILGAIPKTLFFEYRNVAELAEYFVEQHGKVLAPLVRPAAAAPALPAMTAVTGNDGDAVRAYLRSLIAGPIGLTEEEIDFQTGFDLYGVNSVMVVELNEIFERVFGPLSKTLFFEFRNIDELAQYFAENHSQELLVALPAARPTQIVNVISDVRPPPAKTNAQDIAIVSAAGRFPGARNLGEFWDVLREGRDCISEIPQGRFDYRKYFDADPDSNRIYSQWGGFIDDVDRFDPAFFNISPREAELIDPQERLLLEVVWEMLEHAGYTRQRLQKLSDRRVGVFVGALWQPYESAGIEATAAGNVVGPSSLLYSIANRVSYYFDLSGPSMAIDTACSSSLTALHVACQSIRNGESQAAIVAGVNLSLSVSKYLFLAQNRFLSTDGRCRSYGAGGTGYVPGEGICALLVKPLAKAIQDGDSILAVIKGSAINHGGRTNGYTVPNPKAQGNVIAQALEQSGVDPNTITYIEGHGTGTSLGDPIEIAGLEKALGSVRDANRVCAIGSVKSNIGHLEAAAGVASVIKVLLQMQHGQLAPTLHTETLNPNINFDASLFRVQRELGPWSGPRVAGISSFGAGGSNAHVILEQYDGAPPPTLKSVTSSPALFVFSAKTEDRLMAMVARFAEFLGQTTIDLHEIAWTLQLGREAMRERIAVVTGTAGELKAALEQQQWIRGTAVKPLPDAKETSLGRVAEAWVQGAEIDWTRFYGGRNYRFAALPTYPFADERYWIEIPPPSSTLKTDVLHPLLHRNTSDLSEQRYSSTWSGEEFFLDEHRVRTDAQHVQKILPGVAHLEIVRAAIEQASPERPEAATLELRNFVWANPIVVTSDKQISIALSADAGDVIDFEIFSEDGDAEIVHSQGSVIWNRQPAPAALDFEQLKRRIGGRILDAAAVYEPCFRTGLILGQAFQPVTSIQLGDNELLATLRLPANVETDAGDYFLHPSMMDGALHGSIGMLAGWTEGSDKPRLPFALESLRVLAPCTRDMVAWMRYSQGSRPGDAVVKLDVDLCDERGNVCVQIHGFTPRVLEAKQKTLLAVPEWLASESEGAPAEYVEEHVLVLSLATHSYSEAALACFERIQSILRGKPAGDVLMQVVVDDERLAGLSGMLKTAALENPRFAGQLIIAASENVVAYEKARAADTVVRYDNGVRQVLRWQEIPGEIAPVAFHDGGVYLITGGRGALGSLFVNEILERTRTAKVVLTGRAPLTLQSDRVSYRQVDLGNLAEVEKLIAEVRPNGILHAAGMVADSFIVKKDAARFAEVLAPKVTGTENLDRATKNVPLDFFVLFSSITGAIGNVGQADYAAANGFLDHFATYRNRLVAAGERRGLTRSINWPLWRAGGMGLDAATEEMLRQTMGMHPMQTATGMAAFYRALALPYDQLFVMEGELAQMRRALVAVPATPQQTVAVAAVDTDSLTEKTQDYLRKELSGLLKLPAQRIDPNAALEEYGIESLLVMKLTNQLEKTFGSLPKTLFFEYQTIRDLAQYFKAHHLAQLTQLVFPETKMAAVQTVVAAAPVAEKPVTSRRFSRTRTTAPVAAAEDDPIAIVGLSGRYPQANDLEAYWRVLSEGKDCIVEVPPSRWDWREYFTEDRGKGSHHYSKWGGFIEGVDEFDPRFFNIAPREAELLDPQERLFLQHSWGAIEDAGYTRASLQIAHENDLPGQVGVYAGVWVSEYQMFGADKRLGFAVSVASISNRVSYALNLHGPSMTVDTMCSASLTAMHLACQDLKSGRISMAIAGGVNVSIHPSKYLMLSAAQAISTDGHCRTFGDGGDGYIPAEGVGVVVLKRLSDARRDGDHVYGIIRGSALNHGGKTNGYTVPNPRAQTSAISRALAESHTNPRHISYIEAHGTGTKLGDPIEIAALNKAFRQYTDDTGFCLIGSVKSNIGHCESAAGVAGLTKVLLQMQHRQLVPSLHSTQLNPNIDFNASPFVVNQTLQPWEQPVVDGRTLPRIAGISSFGAGGSNAHLIVEEYAAPVRQPVGEVLPVAIVLSARTAEQLRQRVRDLSDFIGTHTLDLTAMAWTLQTGREAMDERVGFVISSVEQLAGKLRAFAAGEQGIEDAYQGRVKRDDDALSLFSKDADLQETIDKWIARKKLAKVIELWVKGLELDWTKLYGEAQPRRISLPTYPFARERYWIDAATATATVTGTAATAAVLHPLLHRNTSNLDQQRYSSTFTGAEFFLADHQVKSQKVLPGVVYLEMARAAVENALDATPEALELHNTVWSQPIVVSGEKQVRIALTAMDDGQIQYEITSGGTIHCQGRAVVATASVQERLDLAVLRNRMHRTFDAKTVYAACAGMGLNYGPGFQSITDVHHGSGELLANLRLPKSAESTDYVLHPSLMDGALQACIGLLDGWNEGATQPRMPFALDTLRVLAPCTAGMAAWVRLAAGSSATDRVVKLDIDLCDEQGRVCVQMHGFAARSLEGKNAAATLTTLEPVWEPVAFDVGECTPRPGQRVLVIGGDDVRLREAGLGIEFVREIGSGIDHVIWIAHPSAELIEAQEEGVLAGFRAVKALLANGYGRGSLAWTIVMNGVAHASIAGLAGSMAKEYPSWKVRLIEGAAPWTDMLCLPFGDRAWRYEGGHWLRRRLVECELAPAKAGFRQEGVYVLIGGAGGLGEMLSDYLVANYSARLVWIGRREKDAEIEEKLNRTGAIYIAADARKREDLQRARDEVKARYGRIDGVIHSALVLADKSLAHMDEEQFRAGLSAKVDVAVRVEEVFGAEELDFILYFSSIQSFVTPAGQSNYAAGCTFIDAFAERHAVKVVNWGYWGNVGRVAGAEYQERMRRIGLGSIEPEEGLAALEQFLGDSRRQVVILRTSGDAVHTLFGGVWSGVAAAPAAVAIKTRVAVPAPGAGAAARIEATLIDTVCTLLKVQKDDIDVDAELSEFGFDSISLTAFANQVNQIYGLQLMPTLFYEHGTVRRFAKYLEPLVAPTQTAVAVPVAATPAPTGAGLQQKVEESLVDAVCALLKVQKNDIDVNAELSEFGFDSISLTAFANHVNQDYGLELMPTVFYEHATVRSFASYLVKAYAETLSRKFRMEPVAAVAATVMPVAQGRRRTAAAPDAPRQGMAKPEAKQLGAEPIAVIGMSGKFPGAEDLDAFWKNLEAGQDNIREIPPERWDWRAAENRSGVKWGAFIDGVSEFDPLFFGISPREAELIDPQQRLLLMYGWKAFEDAGYGPRQLWGSRTGVFVGTANTGYAELMATQSNPEVEGYSATGFVPSVGPNRLSYVLNLHGPSEPIETACSSSLVAVHRAVRSIGEGECDMALVGGVNTIVSATTHVSFSKAGMLSPEGKCKTFSSSADGYVRGEGVGMLVLKRLSAAERDGDHIYGLIRGSAENHGGRAQSLTAPNPQAQADLIRDTYRRAGVSPRTVSFIETHGTGTSLGDPVEINGLKSAFQGLSEELGETAGVGYCGLASVKSNVGHLELAAGIAGLIKVLLQLEHKTLVPTLHCDEINPYIRLEESPFYIVRKSRLWTTVQDQPRRAGISSFGFGGVNAHVLVEEYTGRIERNVPQGPVVIVLSAKDAERLQEQAAQLWQVAGAFSDSDLPAMAYTLQVGREAMEHRLALVVTSVAELAAKLDDFVEGKSGIEGLSRGEVKRNNETLAVFHGDEELREAVGKWIERGKWTKVLDLWVKGLEIEWEQLYGEETPQRLSLPTYPFAREHYWIETTSATKEAAMATLHPLLHRNTSDLSGQRYSSTFTGEEFFLNDHRLGSQKVLPGVAYLEMARAAMEQASPGKSGVVELLDTVWLQPVVVTEPKQLSVGLFLNDDEQVDFEIRSEAAVHCRGRAVYSSHLAQKLDLEQLAHVMDRASIEPSALYAMFDTMGIAYGPAHRGVTAIRLGDGQLLAQLRLPAGVDTRGYVLHPSVMDAALQASIALVVDVNRAPTNALVPFSMELLRVVSPCTTEMVAWIRHAQDSTASDAVIKLDIDLCDLEGNVCVQMQRFVARMIEPSFDNDFYEKLIADIASSDVSVEEAVAWS